ncbi:MAG: DUF1700 domain-containing protein [Oscillospiraceae bacterium]
MKRIAYLQLLEKRLKYRLPKREINEIIRDYAEYFVEGERQRKTEEALTSELGSPQIVAKQLIGDHMQNLFKTGPSDRIKVKKINDYTKSEPSDEKKLLKYLLIAAIFVVTCPLWGAVLLVLIGIIATVLLLFFTGIALAGCLGIAGIVVGIAFLMVAVALYGFLPNTSIAAFVLLALTVVFGVFTVVGAISLFLRMIFRIVVKKKKQNDVSVAQDILNSVIDTPQVQDPFVINEETGIQVQDVIIIKEVE